jgi:tRNA U34 5-methylaminomethyl-2-thiouridine-forming methyltransferase MnmC
VSGACEVVVTRGGARAMLDRRSGEVMHPIGGPLVECERLYVRPARLAERLAGSEPEPLVLLDVGLGAGSNAAAAIQLRLALRGATRPLSIISFERQLEAFALALAPEHAGAFGWVGAAWDAARELAARGAYRDPALSWSLRRGDVLDALGREPAASADVVFWDPFSPAQNPELWTVAAFRALRRVCRPGASVLTYSGATAVRSALLLAGFWVETGDEIAPGKSATRASTGPEGLSRPLDARWLERLARSSAPFASDAPPDALARVRAHPQFLTR